MTKLKHDRDDLFGEPAQGNLFGTGDDRLKVPERDTLPNPDEIRARLRGILSKARAADRMPWSDNDARMWQTVFPNMAKWLPDSEAEQLCFDFAREMERLKAA